MELIYADVITYNPYLQLKEIGTVDDLISFEMLQSLSHDYEDNDFELQVHKETWLNGFLKVGGWLYIPNTEWVGRIENIEHVEGVVKLTGPTLRGIISRWAIIPPSHFNSSHDPYVRFNLDVSEVPEYLLATYTSENNVLSLRDAKRLFEFKKEKLDKNINFQFRYTQSLKALNQVALLTNTRLSILHSYSSSTSFEISFANTSDYSEHINFNNDYEVGISSKILKSTAYNTVIGLGEGELANRQTITKYRLPNGNIVDTLNTSQKSTFEPKVFIYDYGSVESLEELEKGVTEKLLEFSEEKSVSINIDPQEEIYLGDIVGGTDDVTGLSIKERITEKRLVINSSGYQVEYKAGGN